MNVRDLGRLVAPGIILILFLAAYGFIAGLCGC